MHRERYSAFNLNQSFELIPRVILSTKTNNQRVKKYNSHYDWIYKELVVFYLSVFELSLSVKVE